MSDFQQFVQVITAVAAFAGPLGLLFHMASQFGQMRANLDGYKDKTEEQIALLRTERKECQEREVRAIEQLWDMGGKLDNRLRILERTNPGREESS